MIVSTNHLGRFNPNTGTWEPHSEEGGNIPISSLTLVTYNVWFGQDYFYQRAEALFQIVKGCEAEIICLQEVTPIYLELILNQPWVQANYYISDYTGQTVEPYGVLLLSRIPIPKVFFYQLPTLMARKLLVITPEINGQVIQIATVHLESIRQSAATRKRQLELIFPILARSSHAVLMGDFNFCSTWLEENTNIDPHYQDLWAVLRSDEPGYTEDTDINLMRWGATRKHKKVRFDRMLVRSPIPGWQPKSIELLGTTPVSPQEPDVFPSDHFGLVGKVDWAVNSG
jgi:tyrosyl-DNA phosphodiesterase 2